MSWLIDLLAGGAVKVLGDALLKPVLDLVAKKQDISLEKYRVDGAVAKELISAEIERAKAQRELGLAAMNHPVWWIAWALFVFPVGLYHATIFLVSTAGIDPEVFQVRRVPATQEQWANTIVGFIFAAQIGSSIVGAILTRFIGPRP